MEDRLQEMFAENERLKKEIKQLENKEKITLKVSEKGALSILGIRRFPITLYVEECQKIFSMKEEILEFIGENKDKFSKKEDRDLKKDEKTEKDNEKKSK